MKFVVNSKIFEKWPDVKIGVIVLSDFNNNNYNQDILNFLRDEETKQNRELQGKDFNLMPEIAVWKTVYRDFGSNPGDYRSSIEALLRRVRTGNLLPQINNLVDLYNFLSIKYHLPAGAEDLDKTQGDIELSYSDGTETGKYIGANENDICYKGEVIYKDQAGFICRRWNWREADRTKIDENTKNAVLVFEAMPPYEEKQFKKVLDETTQLITKYLAGKHHTFILTKENSSIDFNFETGKRPGVNLNHPEGGVDSHPISNPSKQKKSQNSMADKTTKSASLPAKVPRSVAKKGANLNRPGGVNVKKELPPKEFVSYQIISDIFAAVKKAFPEIKIKLENIHLEHPTDESHGDYSTNIAMQLVKDIKTNPIQIAEKIAYELQNILPDYLSKAEAVKPGFINLFLKFDYLIEQLNQTLSQKENFGKSNWGVNKKWLIEHTSPNPNKAMHLGHLRNNVTGMAIANTWEYLGVNAIRDCIDNNRGIAIAKLMWGYLKFAKKNQEQPTDINYWFDNQDKWQVPEDKNLRPDRFVDELYTLASEDFENNKQTEENVRLMVLDWENNDKKNWALWAKVLSYSYQGQELTLKRLGNKWDKVWHEHEHYKMGKDLVSTGEKLGIFRKSDDGAILSNLEKYHLSDTVIIKSDGTALYITQDLALTKLKRETFHPDKIHWVIGPEQSLALKQMYAVCEQLGIGKLEDYIHIAYGYMSIKGKGKMSSRLGNVVYIDELLDEAKNRIAKIMKNAQFAKLLSDAEEKEKVTEALGVGAVKYSILKVGRMQNIAFDFEESLSFDGNSGPYLQYTFARAKSILAKNQELKTGDKKSVRLTAYGLRLNEEEQTLLRLLYQFPEVVLNAAQNYAPNVICTYLYNLAQKFNSFYDKVPILKAENKSREVRLKITEAVAQVLRNGLKLLGIDTPERM